MTDCVIYNRISTDNRDQKPESNINKCREYRDYNGYREIDLLIDEGVSGDSFYYDRPKGKVLYDYIQEYKEKGEPLVVIVFSIDRFTRQHPDYAVYILRELKEGGVEVESATESIFNEDTEFSPPLRYNILWFNHYFLAQHSKKVKAGIEKRRSEGKKIGRKSDLEEGDTDRIKHMAKSMSYRKIKEAFKKEGKTVSISTISGILNEE